MQGTGTFVETDLCSACNGSGEGSYDGARCSVCGGRGEVTINPESSNVDDYGIGYYD